MVKKIFNQGKIAKCFNKLFVDIDPKLASMIPESQTKFDQYLNPHQTLMGEANLTDDEIKEALRSLKPNKSPGYDNISTNVINETSDIFFTCLHALACLFNRNAKISKKISKNQQNHYDIILENNIRLRRMKISLIWERVVKNFVPHI